MFIDVVEVSRTSASMPSLSDRVVVDRTLVHRTALCEVFLTDARALEDGTFEVSAQLPPSHPYYTDHLLTRASVVDPLLLLECCRQAETLIAHRYLGVPSGQRFILHSWDMVFDGLARAAAAVAPGLLHLVVAVEQPRRLNGVLRSARYRVEMFANHASPDTKVAELSMDVRYAPPDAYSALRADRRAGGDMVSSVDLVARRVPAPINPVWVARTRAENVLLSETATQPEARRVRGRLRLPFGNTSIFDHAQDHVPAMVLTDAARQLALVGLADIYGSSAAHTVLTAVHAEFHDYVELDQSTDLHLHAPDVPVRDETTQSLRSTMTVTVHQGDRLRATMQLALSTLPGDVVTAGIDW